jgi:hypothetical protein
MEKGIINMKSQKPAEGILLKNDWGYAKLYKVICECGSDDHAHDVWVQAEENEVTVTVYTAVKSKWWKLNRWQQIWQLLSNGYIECQTDVIMSEQQALNYAETLKSAIIDVTEFKKNDKR